MHIGEHGIPPWEFVRRPKDGEFFYTHVLKYLNLTPKEMKKHLAALGIELGPYVRKGAFGVKVYKRQYRNLTRDEAKRIIARVRMLQGERLLRKSVVEP